MARFLVTHMIVMFMIISAIEVNSFCRLKSKLDKHMAEAPDAEFVTEDAVFVYHKKFSVK